MSNNVCEYVGMIAALDNILEGEENVVNVYSDSLLVINHLYKNWRVKADNLKPLYTEGVKLLEDISKRDIYLSLRHVRGHQGIKGNEMADLLAKKAVEGHIAASERYIRLITHSKG